MSCARCTRPRFLNLEELLAVAERGLAQLGCEGQVTARWNGALRVESWPWSDGSVRAGGFGAAGGVAGAADARLAGARAAGGAFGRSCATAMAIPSKRSRIRAVFGSPSSALVADNSLRWCADRHRPVARRRLARLRSRFGVGPGAWRRAAAAVAADHAVGRLDRRRRPQLRRRGRPAAEGAARQGRRRSRAASATPPPHPPPATPPSR